MCAGNLCAICTSRCQEDEGVILDEFACDACGGDEHRRQTCQACSGRGKLTIHGCPKARMNPATVRFIQAAQMDHVLPVGGGFVDQPAHWHESVAAWRAMLDRLRGKRE